MEFEGLFQVVNLSIPRLSGGTTNEKFGLAKLLSVMPRDKISMEVYAKYLETSSANRTAACLGASLGLRSGKCETYALVECKLSVEVK